MKKELWVLNKCLNKFWLIVFILLISCTKKDYTQRDCELFSMHSYRGLPEAMVKYKKYCTKYELHYTKEHCQKALTDLILYGDENFLKEKYGTDIMQCFTERNLEKFLKKQKVQ